MQRTAYLALVLLTGCEHTARIRVRDLWRVTASVEDVDAGPVRLSGERTQVDARVGGPIMGPGRGNRGPPSPQRVTLRREEDTGAIAIDAPDTWHHTHDILVDAHGGVLASAPFPNAGSVGWDGDVLRMRLAYTYAPSRAGSTEDDGNPPTIPSFEVWMTTARSNVVEIERRRTPIRGFGWLLLGLGAAMAAGSIAFLSSKNSDVRLVGGVWVGVPALWFLGGAGVLLLTPERVEHERFGP